MNGFSLLMLIDVIAEHVHTGYNDARNGRVY